MIAGVPDLPTSRRSIRSSAVASVGNRVVVLYETGRSGSAALNLASRLVSGEGWVLAVVTVAPQDPRICCGAGSAVDYNRAVCEAAGAELREARELLGPAGERALFKLLVQDTDPGLAEWIAAGDYDVVLLPARRRPLRRAKHPAAYRLRRSTGAHVYVVDSESNFEDAGMEILASSAASSDSLVTAGAGPVHRRGATNGASGDDTSVPRATGTAALGP